MRTTELGFEQLDQYTCARCKGVLAYTGFICCDNCWKEVYGVPRISGIMRNLDGGDPNSPRDTDIIRDINVAVTELLNGQKNIAKDLIVQTQDTPSSEVKVMYDQEKDEFKKLIYGLIIKARRNH